MKHSVWVSYDLGIKGDYEGLYAWLDKHEAKECGDSVAYFSYEHPTDDPWSDMREELKQSVDINPKRNRVYVIVHVGKKATGKFIFGRRRDAPWVGSANTGEQGEDNA